MSAELTNFFDNISDNNPVKLISDPEGFSIFDSSNTQITDSSNETKYPDTKILVLGDLLDSTGTLKNDESKKDKAYNIRNLMLVVKNQEKIKVLLGNRDLNKIKCRPLIEVKDTTIWISDDLSGISDQLKQK